MFIYVIASSLDGVPSAPVKVGITKNLRSRLNSLQTGSPSKLQVVESVDCVSQLLSRDIEKWFHAWGKPHHLNGEWFDMSPDEAVRRLVKCFKLAELIRPICCA